MLILILKIHISQEKLLRIKKNQKKSFEKLIKLTLDNNILCVIEKNISLISNKIKYKYQNFLYKIILIYKI